MFPPELEKVLSLRRRQEAEKATRKEWFLQIFMVMLFSVMWLGPMHLWQVTSGDIPQGAKEFMIFLGIFNFLYIAHLFYTIRRKKI